MENVVTLRNAWVDYLLSTESLVSSVCLSQALDGVYSRDQFTRMLTSGAVDSQTLFTVHQKQGLYPAQRHPGSCHLKHRGILGG